MYIRLLYGPFNGQIKDMENAAAIALIREGRAENPYLDPSPEAPAIQAKEQEPAIPARRRRGSR